MSRYCKRKEATSFIRGAKYCLNITSAIVAQETPETEVNICSKIIIITLIIIFFNEAGKLL